MLYNVYIKLPAAFTLISFFITFIIIHMVYTFYYKLISSVGQRAYKVIGKETNTPCYSILNYFEIR